MEQDFKKILDSLIERGKAKNGIAASEIMEVIDSADCSIQQIEKIYETLEENGIEVANDLETVTFDIPDEDLLPDDIDESPEEVEEMLLQGGRDHRRPGADVSQGHRQGAAALRRKGAGTGL